MVKDEPVRAKEMSALVGNIEEEEELEQTSDALKHAKYCSERAAATSR